MSDQYSVPAGWYPDPLGHPQLRWWNGEGWTEQVSAAPEPLVMTPNDFAWKSDDEAPVVVQAPAQTVTTAASRELFALEAPHAAAKVEQSTQPTLPAAGYTNNYKLPASVSTAETVAAPANYTKYAATTPEPVPVPVSSAPVEPTKFWNA